MSGGSLAVKKNVIAGALCAWLGFFACSVGIAEASSRKCTRLADDSPKRLLEGRKLLEDGEPQRAITECLQPLIDAFEKAHQGSAKRLYSAQNQGQMFIYLALPLDEGQQGAEVVSGAWADAYLMKAYALTELKKISDAQAALETAVRLSPLNSKYQSELAYTYQVQKDCDKSIETYRQAASVAELGSSEETQKEDLARAWRGEGYCLVEQGKLDEAEALYRKCLDADPKDRKAQGELQYVESLRKK
jgi:tetratricopeptide (TPR) repeat protein